MTEKEPEKLAIVKHFGADDFGRDKWAVYLSNGDILRVFDSMPYWGRLQGAERVAEYVNTAANAWASASIKQAVNAKLEEAAKVFEARCMGPDIKTCAGRCGGCRDAGMIRKIKED